MGELRKALTGALASVLALGLVGWTRDAPPWLTKPLLVAAFCLGAALVLEHAWRCVSKPEPAALRCAQLTLALLIAAQFADGRVSFPFVRFAMFTRAERWPIVVHRYRARFASGREQEFYPPQVLATLRYSRITLALEDRLSALRAATKRDQAAVREREVGDLLRALAAMSNRDHPADRLVELFVYRVELSVDPNMVKQAEQLVLRVDVSAS